MVNGIIDPTKVIRCAMENSCSVAKIFLTSDGWCARSRENEPQVAGNPMDNPVRHVRQRGERVWTRAARGEGHDRAEGRMSDSLTFMRAQRYACKARCAGGHVTTESPPLRRKLFFFPGAPEDGFERGGGGSSSTSASPVIGCSSSIDRACRNSVSPGLAFFFDRFVPVPNPGVAKQRLLGAGLGSPNEGWPFRYSGSKTSGARSSEAHVLGRIWCFLPVSGRTSTSAKVCRALSSPSNVSSTLQSLRVGLPSTAPPRAPQTRVVFNRRAADVVGASPSAPGTPSGRAAGTTARPGRGAPRPSSPPKARPSWGGPAGARCPAAPTALPPVPYARASADETASPSRASFSRASSARRRQDARGFGDRDDARVLVHDAQARGVYALMATRRVSACQCQCSRLFPRRAAAAGARRPERWPAPGARRRRRRTRQRCRARG